MAAQIPDIEPEKFTQGETVKWTKSLSDFSASDGYVLTYEFAGGSTVTPPQGYLAFAAWAASLIFPMSETFIASVKSGSFKISFTTNACSSTFHCRSMAMSE